MRAAILTGPRSLDIGDVELPGPGNLDVLLDVAACGVCGSNLHQWQQDPIGSSVTVQTPGAFGHELSAVVRAVGGDVTGLSVGDLVTVDPAASSACGVCPTCLRGAHWFCRARHRPVSYGFAEQIIVPARATYRVPAGVTPDTAALAEPIACGMHAVRHSWVATSQGLPGTRVLVIGAGMLGLAAAMASRWLGADEVTVVARYPHQAAAAAALGADTVILSGSPGLSDTLRHRRHGLVVEAVGGHADTLALAAEVVAWSGEVAVLGQFLTPQTVDAARALARETRFFFAVGYSAIDGVHDFSCALELMGSGRFPLDGLLSGRYPLDRISDAFSAAQDKRTGAIRVLVTPNESASAEVSSARVVQAATG